MQSFKICVYLGVGLVFDSFVKMFEFGGSLRF